MHTPEEAVTAAAEINEAFPDVTAYPNVSNVDIVARGVSKGEAIAAMKRYLSVSLMGAMGDGHNDAPMLAAADLSFTFPDAPAEVREAAGNLAVSVGEALTRMTAMTEGKKWN